MAIDINKLRKELLNKPKQMLLLNELYAQIQEQHFSKNVTINLPPYLKYSSKLKKTTVHMLGYEVKQKKLSFKFDIYLKE